MHGGIHVYHLSGKPTRKNQILKLLNSWLILNNQLVPSLYHGILLVHLICTVVNSLV